MPRHYLHDYRLRAIYHLTITKHAQCPTFAILSGTPDSVKTERTAVGTIVERSLRNLKAHSPNLKLLQYVIMPGHIHFLLQVLNPLEMPLGKYIGIMKAEVNRNAAAAGYNPPVFDSDFHDRIIRREHSLKTVVEYIRSNPRRLLVRRLYPDFFQRKFCMEINSVGWQTYGNHHLLGNPFKRQVICHRSDTPADYDANISECRYIASNGGVLVSPFISAREKEIRMLAEESGGKIIQIVYEPFGERYKPSGCNFRLCEEGRLLIIAPNGKLPPGRATFLYLNSIASLICSGR